jgi:hypothetical protein
MKVLILGNGLTRLEFDKQIRDWKGEIWGCNRIYLDYGDILTGLAGHTDVMQEAALDRDAKGNTYKIMGGIEDPYICKPLYQKDTGTSLVAEALTRGYQVELCGFDIGGLDVYSPGHEKKNKTTWVQRWRLILGEFGADRVTFWGHDHKPFLLSNRPANEYWNQYRKGESHAGDIYNRQSKAWCNDYSRLYNLVPNVMLKNKGNREWNILEIEGIFKPGDTVQLPESLAFKYCQLYRKEFEMLPLSESSNCNKLNTTEDMEQ